MLDFMNKQQVGVKMICYKESMDDEFLEEIKLNIRPSWKDVPLKIDDDSPQLRNDKLKAFCMYTMKSTLLVKISRPDLEPRFTLIASTVRASAQHHWPKHSEITRLMIGTKDEEIVLSICNTHGTMSVIVFFLKQR